MRDGFLKVMAATPDIRVADCDFNAENIIRAVGEAEGAENRAAKGLTPMLSPTILGCNNCFTSRHTRYKNASTIARL